MLIIGSHVSFKKDKQLLGSVEEAISYGSTTFMFYTGAPQNTARMPINDNLTYQAIKLMKENNIDIRHVVAHAPYIINLANKEKKEQYDFSIKFLINECKRCESMFIDKLIIHPGNHTGIGEERGIDNIANALNKILDYTNITILLETMSGKGTEIGQNINQIKQIIDKVDKKEQLGICLDTCHLSDSGYDINNFDSILQEFKDLDIFNKIKCIHINDSKNAKGSKKDRHENIGFGNLGFDNLINIIYNEQIKDIPKILETPWINDNPPYKQEIDMILAKKFNENIKEDVENYYK